MKIHWLVKTWTLEFWFHPFIWRFRWAGAAKAGRVWCSRNDKRYRWISIGPFTLGESHLS